MPIFVIASIIVLATAILYFGIRFWISDLADRLKLFVKPIEGEIIPILVGNKLDRFVMSVNGKSFEDPLNRDYSIMDSARTNKPQISVLDEILMALFGVHWVGLPPYRVGKVNFKASRVRKIETAGGATYEQYQETLSQHDHSAPIRWLIQLYFTDMEAKGTILKTADPNGASTTQIILLVSVEFEVTNAYNFFFKITGTEGISGIEKVVHAQLWALLRQFVSKRTYDEIANGDHESAGSKFQVEVIDRLNNPTASPGTETEFGLRISAIHINDIGFGPRSKQIADALIGKTEEEAEKARAEARKARQIVEAEAASETDTIKARGQKALIEAQLAAPGAAQVKMMEALPRGLAVYVADRTGSDPMNTALQGTMLANLAPSLQNPPTGAATDKPKPQESQDAKTNPGPQQPEAAGSASSSGS